jgi:hypothetical protein
MSDADNVDAGLARIAEDAGSDRPCVDCLKHALPVRNDAGAGVRPAAFWLLA